MIEWFQARARRDPHRHALTYNGSTWSYDELLQASNRLAGALCAGGLSSGDRLAYFAYNHPHYFTLALALSRLSAVLVPLNARLAQPEAARFLADASAKVLVVDAGHTDTATKLHEAGLVRDIYGLDAAADLPCLDDLISAGDRLPDQVARRQEVMLLMYTSGTTGTPKAAVISNENLWTNAINCLIDADVRRDDVLLLISPVSHMTVWPLTMCTWLKGGHVVLQQSFSADGFFDAVSDYRVCTWGAVTPLLKMIADNPRFEAADLSSLRWIIVGGTALNEEVRQAFGSRGIQVRRAYGLTEAGAMAALMPEEDTELDTTASGKPLLFTEFRVDDIGQGDRVGELCIRGGNVISRYWGDAEAEQLPAQGWIRTGDIGEIDSDGYVHIRDRLKDMIKSGGENVYATEVEKVLLTHPAIDEVAVVGAPHPRWVETVVAVVQPRHGMSLTLEEVRDFARPYLAGFKLPTRLELRDDLPKDPHGKIRKQLLRQMLQAEGGD